MTNAAPQIGDVYLKVTGVDSYVEIASVADYSIATTGELSVSAWMRPDTLDFPRWEETGYVYWLGKGASGKQEWAFRMYNRDNTTETPPRPNRISVYTFNPDGGRELAAIFRIRCRKGTGFSWSASPTARAPTSIGTGSIADATPTPAKLSSLSERLLAWFAP
jgi:hypothetical protein